MKQVDNINPEELPESKDSSNETISLKNNNKKIGINNEQTDSNFEEEIEEIDNKTCFQKHVVKLVQVQ